MNNLNCPLVRGDRCHISQIKKIFEEIGIPCCVNSSCQPSQFPEIQEVLSEFYRVDREEVIIPKEKLSQLKEMIQKKCPFLGNHCDIGTLKNCQMPKCIGMCSFVTKGLCPICKSNNKKVPLKNRKKDGKLACENCQ